MPGTPESRMDEFRETVSKHSYIIIALMKEHVVKYFFDLLK